MSEDELKPKDDRDKAGRWVPGCRPTNPAGRPKLTPVQKYLKQAAGEVSEDLFNILIEMACYTQGKDRWEKIRPSDRLRAIELLLAYAHGKPTQRVEAEIEQKVLNVSINLPENIKVEDF